MTFTYLPRNAVQHSQTTAIGARRNKVSISSTANIERAATEVNRTGCIT